MIINQLQIMKSILIFKIKYQIIIISLMLNQKNKIHWF